jgi:hypothetical protein
VKATHTATLGWTRTAQMAVHGEDVAVALAEAGLLDPVIADQVTGHAVTTPVTPDLAVAHLIRAVTNPDAREVLRTILPEVPTAGADGEMRGVQDRLRVTAPLIERAFRHDPLRRETATAALEGDYLHGQHARRASWTVSGRSAAALYAEASAALAANPGASAPSDAAMEMLARWGITSIVYGMILSDQGSQFNRPGDPRRGKPAKVLSRMGLTEWGLQTLRDIGEALETGSHTLPVVRDTDGHVVTELVSGSPQHVHYVAGSTANRHIRTVLLGSHGDPEPAPQTEQPEVAAQRLVTSTATKIAAARDRLEDAVALTQHGSSEPVLRPGAGINADLARTMSTDLSELQRLVNRHAEDDRDGLADVPMSLDLRVDSDLFSEGAWW